MEENKDKEEVIQIDVKGAIQNKSPRAVKFIPKFVMNYIKRVTHEKEINEFFKLHGTKKDFEFIDAVLSHFNVKVDIKNPEKIRKDGGIIFASNHPLGGLDGMALIYAIGQVRKDVKFIVNDILLQLRNLDGIFIGVNKHGKNVGNSLAIIEELYGSDKAVLIFPAGLVSRKQQGHIKDLEWKKSFISKAKKYQKDIIPVHIDGQNSKKFYNLALWRKRIGIKANIEMFYLVDEMFKQRGKTLTMTFGEPIPYTKFDKKHTDLEWAQIVKKEVYALGTQNKTT
jgi:putative hemolysin